MATAESPSPLVSQAHSGPRIPLRLPCFGAAMSVAAAGIVPPGRGGNSRVSSDGPTALWKGVLAVGQSGLGRVTRRSARAGTASRRLPSPYMTYVRSKYLFGGERDVVRDWRVDSERMLPRLSVLHPDQTLCTG